MNRDPVRHTVILSPGTVQAVSEGRAQALTPPRARQTPSRANLPAELRDVDPLTLREALRLAGGDPGRLHFRPDGSVVITNRQRAGVDTTKQR